MQTVHFKVILIVLSLFWGSQPVGAWEVYKYRMPDGSVVYYQYANQNGSFDAAQGSKANCPWNKGKTQ